ncbi:hypothetical protein LBMAG21_16730 [Armatimonadota bacterium]|nr:hypothetical protein LBMAG21_16730 [Armatimonadota bacterium]
MSIFVFGFAVLLIAIIANDTLNRLDDMPSTLRAGIFGLCCVIGGLAWALVGWETSAWDDRVGGALKQRARLIVAGFGHCASSGLLL